MDSVDKARGFTNHKVEHFIRDGLHVAIYAILGTLCRQGLSQLVGPSVLHVTPYPLFPSLIPNMLGSYLMGYIIEAKLLIITNASEGFHVAWTAGFCGSLTTFSSWMFAITYNLVVGNVVFALFTAVLGLTSTVATFQAGRHTHYAIHCRNSTALMSSLSSVVSKDPINFHESRSQRVSQSKQYIGSSTACPIVSATGTCRTASSANLDLDTNSIMSQEPVHDSDKLNSDVIACARSIKLAQIPKSQQKWRNDVLLVILAVFFVLMITSLTLGIVYDTNTPRSQTYWQSATFAPLGAITRWQLARLNSRQGAMLPWGTFTANMIASIAAGILEGVVIWMTTMRLSPWSPKMLIVGVIGGFCGSLSTASSFVGELHMLPLGRSYIYGVLSITVGCVLCTAGFAGFVYG
eukprot:Lankesteria_metandrocarpae@DN5242_c1_g1_i3.p1